MEREGHNNFILDVSALTKGLGNIKKWVVNNENNTTLYIPAYTIHELDFLKKGTSVIATNARESVRFIEKMVTDENPNEKAVVILEGPDDSSLTFKRCVKYKIRAPRTSEFPTSIRSTVSALKYERDLIEEAKNISDADEEDLGEEAGGEKAKIPPRLRYLIRPAVKKVRVQKEDWRIITEDLTVKIWCESFGIKCVNINEVESEFFHNSIGLKTDLLNKTEVTKSGHHSKNKKRTIKAKKSPKEDPREETDGVLIEKFNSISFAPRGRGDLWVP